MTTLFELIIKKAIYTVLLVFVPAILMSQDGINNLQAQEILNKSDKNQFFIENKGQWDDKILFLARTSGLNYWITRDGIVYDFYQVKSTNEHQSKSFNTDLQSISESINGHIVKSTFQKNNIANNTSFTGINKQSCYYNYFIGNNSYDWASNVPLYIEVYAKNIYEGIDARYYFDNNRLRYDFIISPHADINQIRFNFEGQEDIFVNDKGELEFKTSIGNIIHNSIFAYQVINNTKKQLKCVFILLNKNMVGFSIKGYNPNYSLTIDPIIYSTYIGGNNLERGYDLVVDISGNCFVTGTALSSNFPITTGAYKTTFAANSDAFIFKLNTSGSALIFSTFIGGNNTSGGYDETASTISLDAAKNILISGVTGSNNYPTTAGVYQTSYGGGASDGFISKLNSSGTALIYSTLLGGSSEERIFNHACDINGNIFVVGAVGTGSSYPVTGGVFQPTYQGGTMDGFLTKLNSNASALIFSTFIGGNLYDNTNRIAIDASGNSYLGGQTYSSNLPTTTGAFRSAYCGGAFDAFVMKINSTGTSAIYLTYLGGSGAEAINGLAIDNSGNSFLTGYTSSTNFPTTIGSYKTTYQGGTNDVFICKLNSSGSSVLFSTYLGGSGDDYPTRLRLYPDNNLLISGRTSSTNFPLTNCPLQNSYGGGAYDGFITIVDSSFNSLDYSTFLGGSGDDQLISINFFDSNNIFVTGLSGSLNYPLTPGSYQTIYGGSTYDAIVTKILIDNTSLSTGNINPIDLCPESPLIIPYSGCAFNAGNIFTAQLSDSNGNFLNPTAIGSKAGTSSGNINGKLPPNIKPGTKYRIRVVASNPSTIGSDNSIDIIINPLPKVNFITYDTIQCISANNFIFTNSSQITKGSLTYKWDFGDGLNGNSSNVSHSYTSIGNYTVKLIATSDKGCIDSFIHRVYVTPQPVPKFGINDSIQCLANNQFVFTNTSDSAGITFKWKISNGYTLSSYHLGYFFPAPGKYTIKLIASSGSVCKDSIQKNIEVLPGPKADFAIDDTLQCLSNNNFNFTNLSDTAGGVGYKWFISDNTISGNYSIGHCFLKEGIYQIKLVLTSKSTFCQDSLVKTVRIVKSPSIRFDVTDSVQCVDVNNFLFNNKSDTSLSNVSFNWDFGDGSTSGGNSPSHKYDTPGIYYVKLVVNAGSGCIDSLTKPMQVISTSLAEFIFDTNDCSGLVVFHNLSSGATDFAWDFDDGNTSTDENPQHTFDAKGFYNVRLIASRNKGCYDTISKLIQIVSAENKIYVPNVFTPNNDGINEVFKVTGLDYKCEKYRLIIYNRWGEKIYDSNDSPNEEPMWNGRFKYTMVSPGVYFYIILGKKISIAGSVTVIN